jgi:putative GTP pyrophosphokinase
VTEPFQDCIEEYRRNRHHLVAWCESVRHFFAQHPTISTGPFPVVHSIRARMKDEERLRDKLKRKALEGETVPANELLSRITDLAGVRVLHLYQDQFVDIHAVIAEQIARGDWVLREPPVAYTWDPEFTQFFEGRGIKTELKPSHYTSIHFTVKPRTDSNLTCEIQVRTLFEEAWGEIDHKINYPTETTVKTCREQLRVLAKLVGASTRLADSIFRSHAERGPGSAAASAANVRAPGTAYEGAASTPTVIPGATPTARLPVMAAAPLVSPLSSATLRRDHSSRLSSFFDENQRLKGRFAEIEDFHTAVVGLQVKWTGVVQSVKTYSRDITLHLAEEGSTTNYALVEYPLSWRERLYALRGGDVVEVTGTISGVNFGAPSVRGESLRVVT